MDGQTDKEDYIFISLDLANITNFQQNIIHVYTKTNGRTTVNACLYQTLANITYFQQNFMHIYTKSKGRRTDRQM